MNITKIYLASPRGYCAGVSRAINIVDKVLQKHGKSIYVRHHIVHNDHIVKGFEKKGVIFVERIEEVPQGSVIVFSAHGSSPELYSLAKERNLTVYDATCPLVTKVHLEAKRYASEGYYITYIGHKNHPEAVGVMGEVPAESIMLIDSLADIAKLKVPSGKEIIVLTQTTLSMDDTKQIVDEIKKKYPQAMLPPAFDICYATQNRQNAVKELAKKTEIIFVVGSKTSSNSNKLRDVAVKQGIEAHLINDKTEIDMNWVENKSIVGVTAGASAPDELIREVINYLSNKKTVVEEITTIKESIIFPLPKNL